MIRSVRFVRDLVSAVQRDDVPGASAELAFRFLFALFPFFIFLGALSGFVMTWLGVSDPSGRVVTAVSDMLPADAASVLETQLREVLETTRGGLLSVSALVALWAAATGTRTLMKMMDRAHGVEGERPFLAKYVLSVALTLLAAGAFVAGFVLLVVGRLLADAVGLESTWLVVVDVLRIPVAFAAVFGAVTFVYSVAPSAPVPLRRAVPGAVVAVGLWLLATLGFALYLANFGAYGETYGALGGVIVLMLWFYITSFVVLLGAEVNAVLIRATPDQDPQPPDQQTDRVEAPEATPAAEA